MRTLNIIYKNKATGKKYVRFVVLRRVRCREFYIFLFCLDDNSTASDIYVTSDMLKRDYVEVERFMEDE